MVSVMCLIVGVGCWLGRLGFFVYELLFFSGLNGFFQIRVFLCYFEKVRVEDFLRFCLEVVLCYIFLFRVSFKINLYLRGKKRFNFLQGKL